MRRRGAADPPGTPPAPEYPYVRCGGLNGCGMEYNKLKWGKCPECAARDSGLTAYICRRCGTAFFSSEASPACSKCEFPEPSVFIDPDDLEDND